MTDDLLRDLLAAVGRYETAVCYRPTGIGVFDSKLRNAPPLLVGTAAEARAHADRLNLADMLGILLDDARAHKDGDLELANVVEELLRQLATSRLPPTTT